jgi:hypothetical protein
MTDRQQMLAAGKKFREASLAWYDQMIATSEILSEEEKQAFDVWEETHVDGSGLWSTGDWPGWEQYIGKKPEPPPRTRRDEQ